MSFVIFTDLDGTLLDHASYSYAPAEPALALLHKLEIPLILASSKTAFEIAPLREELDLPIVQPLSKMVQAFCPLMSILKCLPTRKATISASWQFCLKCRQIFALTLPASVTGA